MTSSCRTLLASFATLSGLKFSFEEPTCAELFCGCVCTDCSFDLGACPTQSAAENPPTSAYQRVLRATRGILPPAAYELYFIHAQPPDVRADWSASWTKMRAGLQPATRRA